MSPLQYRADPLPRALDQLARAARRLAELQDLLFEQALRRGDDSQLRQRCTLAFLAAALLPFPHATAPTLTRADGVPRPDVRLVFLPLSRGPPSLQRQPVLETAIG